MQRAAAICYPWLVACWPAPLAQPPSIVDESTSTSSCTRTGRRRRFGCPSCRLSCRCSAPSGFVVFVRVFQRLDSGGGKDALGMQRDVNTLYLIAH